MAQDAVARLQELVALAGADPAALEDARAGWKKLVGRHEDRVKICGYFGLPQRDGGDAHWDLKHSRLVSVGAETLVVQVVTRRDEPFDGVLPRRIALKLVQPSKTRKISFDHRLAYRQSPSPAVPSVGEARERFLAMDWIDGEVLSDELDRIREEETAAARKEPPKGRLRKAAAWVAGKLRREDLDKISKDRIKLADEVAAGLAAAMQAFAVPHGRLTTEHVMLTTSVGREAGGVMLLDPKGWRGAPPAGDDGCAAPEDLRAFGEVMLEVLCGGIEGDREARLQALWEILPAYAELVEDLLVEDLVDAGEPGALMVTDAHGGSARRLPTWTEVKDRFGSAARVSAPLLKLEGVDGRGLLSLARLANPFGLRISFLRNFIGEMQRESGKRRHLGEKAMWWSAVMAIFFWFLNVFLILAFTWRDFDLKGKGGEDPLSEQVLPDVVKALYRNVASEPPVGDPASHLISRLLALTFAALAILYYINLLSTLRFEHVRKLKSARAAEVVVRLMPLVLNAIILVGIFKPGQFENGVFGLERPWAVLCFAGMLPVLLCNFLLWKVVKAGTVPGKMVKPKESFFIRPRISEWWTLMLVYQVALAIVAVGLNPDLFGLYELHDPISYAVIIGVGVNLGKLYGSNIRVLGSQFRGTVQRSAFRVARWERTHLPTTALPTDDGEVKKTLNERLLEFEQKVNGDPGWYEDELERNKKTPRPRGTRWESLPIRPTRLLGWNELPAYVKGATGAVRVARGVVVGLWLTFVLLFAVQFFGFPFDGPEHGVRVLALSFAALAVIGYSGLLEPAALAVRDLDGGKKEKWLRRSIVWQVGALPLTLTAVPFLGLVLKSEWWIFDRSWAVVMLLGMLPVLSLNWATWSVVKEAGVIARAAKSPSAAIERFRDRQEDAEENFKLNFWVMAIYVGILLLLAVGLNRTHEVNGETVPLLRDSALYAGIVGLAVNWGKLYATNIRTGRFELHERLVTAVTILNEHAATSKAPLASATPAAA